MSQKKAKLICLLIILILGPFAYGQNLVPNSSFEEVDSLPCSFLLSFEIERYLKFWNNPTAGTADIYTTAVDSSCFNFMPNSTFETTIYTDCHPAYEYPRTGANVVGMFTFGSGDYREYVQSSLLDTIYPGAVYCGELFVSLADYYGKMNNNLGFLLTDTIIRTSASVDYSLDSLLTDSPQIAHPNIITQNDGWFRIADTFRVDRPVFNMIVGNFYRNSSTLSATNPGHNFLDSCNSYHGYAYYFVDDVGIYPYLQPTVSILNSHDTICSNNPISLIAQGGGSYAWEILGDTSNSIFSVDPILNLSPDQTTTYVLHGFICDLVDTDTLTIEVIPFPEVTPLPDTVMCSFSPLLLNLDQDSVGYLWSDSSNMSSFLMDTLGSFWVEITDTLNGCRVREYGRIRLSEPDIALGNDETICRGDSFQIQSVFSSDLNGNVANYLWSDGSTHNSLWTYEGGIYWVEATDAFGCLDRDSVEITFIGPEIELGGDTTLCVGDSIRWEMPIGNTYYELWTPDDYFADSEAFGITAKVAGTYTFQVRDNTGCVNRDLILLSYSEPELSIIQEGVLCQGDSLLLRSEEMYSQYRWSSGEVDSFLWVKEIGNYGLSVTNEFGCYAEANVSVEQQIVNLNLGIDTSFCEGDLYRLSPDSFASYRWSDNSENPYLELTDPGLYWVEVSTVDGCWERDSVQLSWQDCSLWLEMPNMFSPNEDGINERFRPQKFRGIESFHLQIFDRWGRMMFEGQSPLQGWNGQFRGQVSPEGVYFWQVRYTDRNGSSHSQKGSLLLVR